MMDIVITYVDGLDPLWRADYQRVVGKSILEKRFRDWGTLKYLLRGIERNISGIGNVYLVVSRESQVPVWVDRSRLKVILHSDIIPAEYLPVFNSCAIEMYLHRIPGLSERFLYFNDDTYPVRPMSEEDFYPDGKAAIHMSRQLLVMGSVFRATARNSSVVARKGAGLRPSLCYFRPQHTVTPLFRSSCEELFASEQSDIIKSMTPVRTRDNSCQYQYSVYMYLKGLTLQKRTSNKHFSLAVARIDEICAFLASPTHDFVCINDVEMPQAQFEEYREKILASFEGLLSGKSRFEL